MCVCGGGGGLETEASNICKTCGGSLVDVHGLQPRNFTFHIVIVGRTDYSNVQYEIAKFGSTCR